LDLWTLILGSPENKAKTIGEWLPISPDTKTQYEDIIKLQVEGAEDFWTKPIGTIPTGGDPIVFNVPEFKFPDLSGVGKWLLIGGGVLAALYLGGRYIGRKK